MAGETSSGASRRSWLAKRWPSAMLVASLMVLALVSAVSTATFQQQRTDASKAETATTASATLRSTMQQTLSALGGAGAVVGRGGELDLAAFSSFGLGLAVEPGVSTLALEAVVSTAERAAFERRSGFPIVDLGAGGDFVRSPGRDIYYPVVAVSPDLGGTRSILGFDIGNDPVRGPVALAALESGVPQLSPPLQLSTSGEPGFNLVVPLFGRGEPIETIEQRRAASVGFVSGQYSSDELIGLVEQQLPAGTTLAIFDGDQVVRGDSSSEQEGVTRQLSIGGRTWTLSVVVPGGPGIWGPLILFIAGALLAGLVQAVISLARRREEILEVSGSALRAEARRSDGLRGLADALLDAKDEPGVISAIVRCAGVPFGATEIELGVISDDGRTMEVFHHLEGDSAEPTGATIPIEADEVVARVVRARAPFDERVDTAFASAAPLSVHGKTLGAIVLGFDDGRRFDRGDRALVMDLASAGARALEQARLHAAVEQAGAQAERDRARVESQRRLSLQLSRAATAETAADIVLRRAISVSHSLAGGVALAHEDGYLEFVAVHGMAGDDADRMPRLALDDKTASSQTFRTGKESLAATAEGFRSRFPDDYAIAGGKGRGVWALALVAKGVPIGALLLIMDSRHLPSDDDRSAVRALAAQVAPALGRARRSDRTREAAEELQRAMLPATLPRVPGAAVTGLYRSPTQILEVGGDWYDAVETGEDSLMVAVGDVVGRGVAAAATMGQLRVAWRALSQRSDGPGALLTALDRFARDLPGAEVTTVACAELDVATGQLRYACAGHLPPLVVDRDGNARFLEDGRSVPLAIIDVRARDEAQITIQIGDTLVLYSDGLVERRDETLDEGLERLRMEAERLSGSGDDLAERLAASLVDEGRSVDDVAILTLTLLPSFRRVVERDALELAPTRAAVRAWMHELGAGDEMVEEMVLASGEALANAIEHAATHDPIEVRGWRDHERITLRVTDRGAWANGEPMTDRGFGLAIMRELMDDVHVETDERGTRVELRRAIRPGDDGAVRSAD